MTNDDLYIAPNGMTYKEMQRNVWETTLDRLRWAFQNHDRVVVMYSGGKDSTVLLELTILVAQEFNKTIDVINFDDEIIDPDTTRLIGETAARSEINFHWFCLPILHSLNGVNRTEWITWDLDERHVWAREYPAQAITESPSFTKPSPLFEVTPKIIRDMGWAEEKVIAFMGIRIGESFNRWRSLLTGGGWVSDQNALLSIGKPIFDWETKSIWKAIIDNQWQYSDFYDRIHKYGYSLQKQRVAPWGNASSGEAHIFPQLYPDFWNLVIKRLPELRAVAKFQGRNTIHLEKPDGWRWEQYGLLLLSQMKHPASKKRMGERIVGQMKRWRRGYSADIPFPDSNKENDFISWQHMCAWIIKNDISERNRT